MPVVVIETGAQAAPGCGRFSANLPTAIYGLIMFKTRSPFRQIWVVPTTDQRAWRNPNFLQAAGESAACGGDL